MSAGVRPNGHGTCGEIPESMRNEVQLQNQTITPRLPNFFIVGAPKCATTSMDHYLGQHPDIFMCPSKETHYFADDLYPRGTKCSWTRYSGFFADAKNEAIVGESSVFYMLSQTAAQAIRDFEARHARAMPWLFVERG